MVKIDHRFQEALESYLQTKGVDIKTEQSYLFFYHKFINLYPELNQKNVDIFLQYNNNSPARAMIKNLKSSIMRWEFPYEIKNKISIIDIPKITGKQDKKMPKFIRKSDVDRLDLEIKLGDYFQTERLKLMILTQFYAGLRLSEVLGITYNDLQKKLYDVNKKFQKIRISYESAKFGKERVAHIPTDIYIRISRWISYGIKGLFIKTFRKDKPIWNLKSSRYKSLFSEHTEKILGEAYNTHSLRHGRGTNLIVDEKMPIEFVKEYLGHADIKSTQRYTHLGDENIDEELEK